jgi:hypothetical protein
LVQREFTGSRLEKQILIRAFELVMAAQRTDRVEDEQPHAATGRPPLNPCRSQGA